MRYSIVVSWRCTAPRRDGKGRFNKITTCSNEAISSGGYWICDFGRWTTDDDEYHTPLRFGIRETADCTEIRKDVNIRNIMQVVEPVRLIPFLEDPSVCEICQVPGCPGSVRFDKKYFELVYIETNLPICLYKSHKVARR